MNQHIPHEVFKVKVSRYMLWAILSGIYCFMGITELSAQYTINQDFESQTPGDITVTGASRENCEAWPEQCNSGVCPDHPLLISNKQAREGSNSVRFEFDKNNWILHHDGYCAVRNEIRWDVDLREGEEAWYGFSVFPTEGEEGSVKYNSSGDTWICQIKNECGSGNRGGIQIRGNEFKTGKDGVVLGAVKYNQWNDIVIHYKYHLSSGFIKYWVNGVMYSKDYNTKEGSCKIDFKIGCYGWHPDGKTVIYFDAVKVKKGIGSYDDVSPGFECNEENTPAKPSNLLGNITGSSQITLNWADSSNNEKGFKIERKTSGGDYAITAHIPQDITSYTDKNLTGNQTYFYRVSSYNCLGTSETSQEVELFLPKDNSQRLLVESHSASLYLGSYTPDKALDNNLNTYWMVDGELQWLQLNLEKKSFIDRVVLSFVNGDTRSYNFDIELSDDGVTWAKAGEFTSNGTSKGLEEYNIEDTEAKYVRFVTGLNSIDERTWLAEMQLWGYMTTGSALAFMPDKDNKIALRVQDNSVEVVILDPSFLNSTVQVYDLVGALITKSSIQGNHCAINVDSYTPGIYLFSISNARNQLALKVKIK